MATLAETYLPLTTKLVNEDGKGLSAVQTAAGKYAIRDANARAAISGIIPVVDSLSTMVQGGVHYIGRTSTALSDGSTTTTITIAGESKTAKQGDMVSLSVANGQDREFILGKGANDTPTWYELGSTGSLKALAFKDSASGNVTVTGSTGEAGALTVDFSNATYSGALGTLTASWSGTKATGLTGDFTGTPATLTGDVSTTDTNLTVQFSSASVNVITSVSTDAIKAPPALTSGTVHDPSGGMTGATDGFTRLTAATTSSLAVGTGFYGSSTIFSGSYTPSGSVVLTGLKPVGTVNIADPVMDFDWSGAVATGSVNLTGVKSSGTVAWNGAKPTGTVSKPDIDISSGNGNYLTGATVTNEVLSFGSATAISAAEAGLVEAPTFTGTGFSGTPSFSGATPSGTATFTGTGISGTPDLTFSGWSGTNSWTFSGWSGSATFSGSGATINVSGTPLGDLTKTTISYVKSVLSADDGVSLAGTVSVPGTFLTSVAYSGSGTAATITSGKGDVAATGSQTLTYKKPTTVSISYTPSGSVTLQDYTPAGTVTVSGKPGGSISGTQTVNAHTHTFSDTETVTVS